MQPSLALHIFAGTAFFQFAPCFFNSAPVSSGLFLDDLAIEKVNNAIRVVDMARMRHHAEGRPGAVQLGRRSITASPLLNRDNRSAHRRIS